MQDLTWSMPLLKKQANSQQAANSAEDKQSANGLICLKGGDLTAEIAESNARPLSIEIHEIFDEEYFQEKYILFVQK